jgi:hypothetical protein
LRKETSDSRAKDSPRWEESVKKFIMQSGPGAGAPGLYER